jgi:hypothetical protein
VTVGDYLRIVVPFETCISFVLGLKYNQALVCLWTFNPQTSGCIKKLINLSSCLKVLRVVVRKGALLWWKIKWTLYSTLKEVMNDRQSFDSFSTCLVSVGVQLYLQTNQFKRKPVELNSFINSRVPVLPYELYRKSLFLERRVRCYFWTWIWNLRLPWLTLRLPWLRFFRAFSSVVRQTPG